MNYILWYIKTRPYELGSWLTRGLNVLLGGKAAETTSARAYRLSFNFKAWDVARRLINLTFRPFEKNHCQRSYMGRVMRAETTLIDHEKLAKTRSIE